MNGEIVGDNIDEDELADTRSKSGNDMYHCRQALPYASYQV